MKFFAQTGAFGNQRGAALLTAIMVLALLTLLGMVITSAGLVEMNIVHNSRVHDMAFYQAEAGRHYAARWLADQPEPPLENLGSVLAPASWAQAFSPARSGSAHILRDDQGQPCFSVDIVYLGSVQPPLYSTEFRRYDYALDLRGYGPQAAASRIQANLGRMHTGGGY